MAPHADEDGTADPHNTVQRADAEQAVDPNVAAAIAAAEAAGPASGESVRVDS